MGRIETFKDLSLYKSLTSIVTSEDIPDGYSQNVYLIKKDTLKLVKKYLAGDDYYSLKNLLDLEERNKIVFGKKESNRVSKIDNSIHINYTKTLKDSFSIIDVLYKYGLNIINESDIERLFEDTMAFVEQLRFYKYLKGTNLKGYAEGQLKDIIYTNKLVGENAKKELELYNHIKDNEGIVFSDLSSELHEYYYNYKFCMPNISIDDYGEYLLSRIIAIYINNKLDNKDVSIDTYKNLKQIINRLSIKDISQILDLDIYYNKKDGLFISNHSINKLSKVYKLEVKKLNE